MQGILNGGRCGWLVGASNGLDCSQCYRSPSGQGGPPIELLRQVSHVFAMQLSKRRL